MSDANIPDRKEAEAAVRTLLRFIGEDDTRKGLLRTPTRVLNCYEEWFGGYKLDPREILGTSFPDAEGYDDIVVLKDIDFESHCEHHIAPFIGKVHIAYLPSDRVVGVSKLVKVVQALSKRLQVQEKLTKQIADCINGVLEPRGVAVIIEAQHQCMTTRGVYKKEINMMTNAMRGAFADDPAARAEVMELVYGNKS
ncbi:MAG: GTP cyclohydrolase I FolE [Gammaproteobacteria bacterium]|nr:GTP cyclohydrolase I FolE [Gammaproteobacteria bacterium]